ncbi:MAG: GH36 C-terminal domain-containing protein, partial [Spirochaetales bacterium]|nr:GH36 C-terminal domain-containing protein [Spirochaetales bacterium]
EFYKKKRKTFQFGRFSRFDSRYDNIKEFQVTDIEEGSANNAVYGFFQTIAKASPSFDIVKLKNLDAECLYTMETLAQSIDIREFGSLIKHVSPVKLNPNGIIMNEAGKHYRLPACVESYTAYGSMLEGGIRLNQRYAGTAYNDKIRLLSDFGSELYIIEKTE